MKASDKPIVGLMLGDVTGIGAEIAARMLATQPIDDLARTVIVGDARHFALGCREAGFDVPVQPIDAIEACDWSTRGERGIPLLDLGNLDPAQFPRAELSADAGQVAGATLHAMTALALAGKLDAVCFAPLNKAALHRGGWKYHDEHQMFADWTQHVGYYSEMNVIPEFSTFRVSSHVALRQALDLITPERIEQAIRLADATMRATGVSKPHLAVAALNPHGGEHGLFGDEEIRIIRPTVEKVKASGIDCEGPLPSDTIFLRARDGHFDAVVIMYHDQGQIATKLLGFQKGVTVTAGLKTVFTTPAHGTAFDIVGKRVADAGAMTAAFTMAARLGTVAQQRRGA